jgi:hypothetical protein
MSNLTIIANELSNSESLTESCQTPPSLAISKHSLIQDVQNYIEALRMSLRADSLASHTAERESNSPATMSETCGLKPFASLKQSNQNGYYWKTYQESLIPGTCGELQPTWQGAVMWDLQQIYQRWDLERITNVIEYGLSPNVPTIGKNEYKGAGKLRYRGSPQYRGAKMSEGLRKCESDPIYLSVDYAEASMMFPHTWTELAPLEMHNFRQWLEQCGISAQS